MPTFAPHPLLRSRVTAIDVIEDASGENVVLPSSSAVLGIQFRGRVHADDALLSTAGITGIQAIARTYGYDTGTGSVLVRFTPEGAACFGGSAAELADRSVALTDILPRARVDELESRITEASDVKDRVKLVEDFLLALPHAGDSVVARAIALLDGTNAERSDGAGIARIAKNLGLSERQLERRFVARVGITPKRFASLRRFERAIESAKRATLSEAAVAAGYYDQSHFIRDFRRYAQAAPSEILRRRE